MVKKIWIGLSLLLVVLSASFYFTMPENVRIDFTKTKTKFSIWENEKFELAGIEYTRIFDGSKLMRAKSRALDYTIQDKKTEVTRVANFKDGIVVINKYLFDNDATDVEDVPISHEICFNNAKGKIFEYLISNIEYNDKTKNIDSPFTFGKRMKVTWEDGAYRSKVYQNKIASDKIVVRYRIVKDQCFNVRLFDPIISGVNMTYKLKLLNTSDKLRLKNNTKITFKSVP